jgi:2-amino-4-hydroxy-6-hydroxymethyldihydropteridine diphosphokinase
MVIYLGLGSNVGDREKHLRDAVAALAMQGVSVSRAASLYLTEPRDFMDQPWFLNTVVEARTDLSPEQLLRVCLAIEHEAGRVREIAKGPRSIDIDIIFYGDSVIETPELIVPHPRYTGRRFVLAPLVELSPELRDPRSHRTVTQLLEACADPGIVRRQAPPL